mgnify:CR=1 FL=1
MSSFQEKLDEFYLNYDTACILKEDSKTNDIVNMFKTELDYPEILTTAILKFPKISYILVLSFRILNLL